MTVEQLISILSTYPANAQVIFNDGDYKDSWSHISRVEYHKEILWFGYPPNVVILDK